jgi:uncharacterized membrane protein YraQ (UPF0718 family)
MPMAGRLRVLDGTLLVLVAAVATLAWLAYARGGEALLRQGLGDGGMLLYRYALLILVSFLAAGLAGVVVPEQWMARNLGVDSGLRGILLAAAAGVVTPAGPFVSIPIAAVMIKSGVGSGPVVAFLAGWSLLALHRFIAWEVPLLGWRFALLRYSTCLVLPPIAGLIARAVTR